MTRLKTAGKYANSKVKGHRVPIWNPFNYSYPYRINDKCKLGSVSVKYSYVFSLTKQYIIITMMILSMIEVFRVSILETLFNPILSDSFGLNERGTAYVFLAFGAVDIAGSILL